MAKNASYTKGLNRLFNGGIDLDTDTLKVVLVDANDYALSVTGATNATPIVITSASHGLSNGDQVLVFNVGGNTAANAIHLVANQTTNTFELTDLSGTNVAGNGSYTSGGFIIKLSTNEFLSDIPAGGRVATSSALSSVSCTASGNGAVFDAADVTFSAVTGDQVEVIVIYKDTGSASTSPLLLAITDATNLPVTPNGGDITIAWSNGTSKILRLNNSNS